MDKIQAFVKVVAEVKETKLVTEYEGPDGKMHQKTVVEKNYVFPEVEALVRPIAFNPQNPAEQLWLVEGEREKLVPLFDKLIPLTLAQANELCSAWGGTPSAHQHLISQAPLFQPKEG
jgi:hypothetical protein